MPLPDVSGALWDLADRIRFRIMSKGAKDFEIYERQNPETTFFGVLQTIDPQKLSVQAEGQRKWNQYTLWTTNMLELDTIIIDSKDVKYRIMTKANWDGGGYNEYELMENPTI
jgi:hypothetical protein